MITLKDVDYNEIIGATKLIKHKKSMHIKQSVIVSIVFLIYFIFTDCLGCCAQ